MAIIRNILVRAGADIRPLEKQMAAAKKTMDNFKKTQEKNVGQMNKNFSRQGAQAGKSMGAVVTASSLAKGALLSLATAASVVGAVMTKNGVTAAIEYEASLQQINRILGSNSAEFMKWANTQALGFNMSRKEAVKYGSVYGNLIMTITSDQRRIQTYTQDLLKASAVVASATGRTMEDVMERIRSGLLGNTEAIEDLGINVNVALIETTNAFKRFANGKSWEQLNFQTQQQIRLFAILEQAMQKYGSEINQNTNSSLQQLNAIMQNVQLNIGQAFLPLINLVVPILISFANTLEHVTSVFSQFTQILFGSNKEQKISTNTAKTAASAQTDLGKATKKAGDAAKKGVAGFDEVNQLQEQMAENADALSKQSGSSGAGTGTGQDTKTPAWIQKLSDDFKRYLGPLSDPIAQVSNSFNGLRDSFVKLGDALSGNATVQKVLAFISEFIKNLVIGKLTQLAGEIDILSGAIKLISAVFSGDFDTAIKGSEEIAKGWYEIVTAKMYPFFPEIATKMQDFKNDFGVKWAGIKEDIKKYGDPAKIEASDFGNYIRDKVKEKWDQLRAATDTKWGEIKSSLKLIWDSFLTTINWDSIKNAVSNSWESLKTETATKWVEFKSLIDELWKAVLEFVTWTSIKDKIVSTWEQLKTETSTKFNQFKINLGELWGEVKAFVNWDDIKNAIVASWGKLNTETSEIWGNLKTTIKNSINDVIEIINGFIRKVNEIKISIPSVDIPGVGKVGGKEYGFKIPTIPRLAKGGIISSPTIAQIGEAGPEAVVPLENTSFIDTLASAIGNSVMAAMQFTNKSGAQSGSEIVLQVDSTKLARVMMSATRSETNRQGNVLISTI